MKNVQILVIESLANEISTSDQKTQKLFKKQKIFMSMDSQHPSLGKTKLRTVKDKYGNPLWEIRLNRTKRIVFVERDNGKKIVWLKICSHDELKRKQIVSPKGNYEPFL